MGDDLSDFLPSDQLAGNKWVCNSAYCKDNAFILWNLFPQRFVWQKQCVSKQHLPGQMFWFPNIPLHFSWEVDWVHLCVCFKGQENTIGIITGICLDTES